MDFDYAREDENCFACGAYLATPSKRCVDVDEDYAITYCRPCFADVLSDRDAAAEQGA